MIDNKLKGGLRQNADAILEIMERNGFDVSKYRKLAEELKEKDKQKKEKAKKYRENYKTSATAFLNAFAYSDIRAKARQEEKSNLLALKDCLLLADKQTEDLENFLSVATAIENGKKPYYKKAQPLRLKSIENMPDIVETARKRQEERHKQAKQDFIKYYSESWFFILLDLIKSKQILRG